MSEVSIDRDKALRIMCNIDDQFKKIAEKEAAGLAHGQNIEALRIWLLRGRKAFPDDFEDDLAAMIAGGNEAGKPP